MKRPPEWMQEEILVGVQRLYHSRLKYCPSAENIQKTATEWVDTVFESIGNPSEDLDRNRIRGGFSALRRTCYDWPSPARLINEMPKRKANKRLPPPMPTKAEQETARKNLAKIFKIIEDGDCFRGKEGG